jgi:hypothetical protein
MNYNFGSGPLLTAAAVWTMGMSTGFAAVQFDLNQVMTGDSPQNSAAVTPWLRATFTDQGVNLPPQYGQPQNGHVYLLLEAVNLYNIECVKEWAFNIDPTIDAGKASGYLASHLEVSTLDSYGSFLFAKKTPISISENGVGNPFMSFAFDFEFNYTTGGDITKTFSQGDKALFDIYMTDGTVLAPGTFKYTALDNQGGTTAWYTAAHIQNTSGPQGSGKIGATGFQITDDNILVPEPRTILAGLLLLLPFGASAVRILRRNRPV